MVAECLFPFCEERWNQENFQQGIGDESWICGGLDESHSNGVIAAPKCGEIEDFGALSAW
jgi:hypothetical protein